MNRLTRLIIILALFFDYNTFFQISDIDTFEVHADLDTIYLKNKNIIPSSVHIIYRCDSLKLAIDSFKVNSIEGLIYDINFNKDTGIFIIEYKYLDLDFDLRSLKIVSQSPEIIYDAKKSDKSVSVAGPKEFNIVKSGNIFRRITFSTNSGISMSSGLNLKLSGELADGIIINGVLSDQNIPIQPEGNTQAISEVDRIFLEAKLGRSKIVLGDIDYSVNRGRLFNYNRKIQGINFHSNLKYCEVDGSAAVSRGEYNTNYFLGQDGNQGPYQLTGKNGEKAIIVLAGTERVWLDGRKLQRGENADYIIDYSTGQITFTPNVVITSNSRITVDFQYSDLFYSKNILSGNINLSGLSDKLAFSFSALQEKDDKNNTIGIQLTKDDYKRMKTVGSGGERIFVSTIKKDSNGAYILNDSVLVYVGNENGSYSAAFYNIGKKGSYRKVYSDNGYYFEYVDKNDPLVSNELKEEAVYSPARPIKLPSSKNFYHTSLIYKPSNKFNVNGEFAISNFDRNIASSLDDGNNIGSALNLSMRRIIDLQNFGKTILWTGIRSSDKNFRSVVRDREVEFKRKWNLKSDTTVGEKIIEAGIDYSLNNNFDFSIEGGHLKSFEANSNRLNIKSNFDLFNNITFNFNRENIRSILPRNENWIRENYTLGYKWITYSYCSELKKSPLIKNSFFFYKNSLSYIKQTRTGLKYSIVLSDRLDKTKIESGWKKESYLHYVKFSMLFNKPGLFNSDFNMYFQRKKYFDQAQSDLSAIIGRWVIKIRPRRKPVSLSSVIELGRKNMVKKEKLYIKVPMGQGNYIYDSTYSEFIPRENGDYILRIIPSNEKEPVNDGKLNLNVLVGGHLLKSSGFISHLRYIGSIRLQNRVKDGFSELFKIRNSVNRIIYIKNELRYNGNRISDLSIGIINKDNSGNLDVRGYEEYRQKEIYIKIRKNVSGNISNETILKNKRVERFAEYNALVNRKLNIYDLSNSIIFLIGDYDKMSFKYSFVSGRQETYNKIKAIKSSFRFSYDKKVGDKGVVGSFIEIIDVKTNSGEKSVPWEISNGRMVGCTFGWGLNFMRTYKDILNLRLRYEGWIEPVIGNYQIGGLDIGAVL